MENKKLNFRKITITKLNNLHHIKGGDIAGTSVGVRPTTKSHIDTTFTEETMP